MNLSLIVLWIQCKGDGICSQKKKIDDVVFHHKSKKNYLKNDLTRFYYYEIMLDRKGINIKT